MLEKVFHKQSKGRQVNITAKEMFEKLGYTYNKWADYIRYDRGDDRILFWLSDQTYAVEYYVSAMYVEMAELKAINKQCEELGWL